MTNINTKKRLKRHEVSKEKVPHSMQPRDREILKYIHEYRFLTKKLLSPLLEVSEPVIGIRLAKLFHNKYVLRKKVPMHKPDVYGLTNLAYVVLDAWYDIEKPTARVTEKNQNVIYDLFLNHHLLITKIRVTLTLALRIRKDASLSEWIPDKERINEYFITENGREVPRTFAPDSFITLRLEDEECFGDKKFFFLEADRGRKDNDRFLKQMEKYIEYQSTWKKEMGQNKDGTDKGFRVLVVALSDEKVGNLRKKMREAENKWLGSRMFWFTSETKFNPENPETILQLIWQTPKDDTFHSLLE